MPGDPNQRAPHPYRPGGAANEYQPCCSEPRTAQVHSGEAIAEYRRWSGLPVAEQKAAAVHDARIRAELAALTSEAGRLGGLLTTPPPPAPAPSALRVGDVVGLRLPSGDGVWRIKDVRPTGPGVWMLDLEEP